MAQHRRPPPRAKSKPFLNKNHLSADLRNDNKTSPTKALLDKRTPLVELTAAANKKYTHISQHISTTEPHM